MTKPWLDTWEPFDAMGPKVTVLCPPYADHERLSEDEYMARQRARVQLAAAAPALVRALLAVEWKEDERRPGHDGRTCPACLGRQWTDGSPARHDADCPVDAALRQAGLETQAERDAAREEMRR